MSLLYFPHPVQSIFTEQTKQYWSQIAFFNSHLAGDIAYSKKWHTQCREALIALQPPVMDLLRCPCVETLLRVQECICIFLLIFISLVSQSSQNKAVIKDKSLNTWKEAPHRRTEKNITSMRPLLVFGSSSLKEKGLGLKKKKTQFVQWTVASIFYILLCYT